MIKRLQKVPFFHLNSRKRKHQDLKLIIEDPPENCTAAPIEPNEWTHWKATIFGSVK